jgi:release factor glutamine methyltransferase
LTSILARALSILEGSESCHDHKRQIMFIASYLTGCEPSLIFLSDHLFLPAGMEEVFFSMVRRRASGEPLQHILGSWDFYGRTFRTDKRALIPRPETEQIIDVVLKAGMPENCSILDVGTGSGAIALTLGLELPGATVIGTDVSMEAIELALENRALLGALGCLFVRCHLADAVKGPFDVVTANLPYIPEGDIPNLPREVRDYDPHDALNGGIDGISLILELVSRAPDVIRSGGLLVLETGWNQEKAVMSMFSTDHWDRVVPHRDLSGNHRLIEAGRK